MDRKPSLILTTIGTLGLSILATGATRSADAGQPSPAVAHEDTVSRGKYLVTIMLCNDCHTPWTMTPRGPEPDMTRMLSGHPQDIEVTSAPEPREGRWVTSASDTMTAWAGAWGVSFTANLTPDEETGLGKWTPETFIAAMRTGRHEGQGRPILPPMPYPWIGKATDEDLRAMFAYLQSIPPIRNRVPMPLDPPEAR